MPGSDPLRGAGGVPSLLLSDCELVAGSGNLCRQTMPQRRARPLRPGFMGSVPDLLAALAFEERRAEWRVAVRNLA